MVIHEYFHYTGTCQRRFFEGRWNWTLDSEPIYEENEPISSGLSQILRNHKYRQTLKWIDLFEKQPEIEFKFVTPGRINHVRPITRHLLLIQYQKKRDFAGSVQLIEFDWSTNECHFGDLTLSEQTDYKVLVDRSCTDGNLKFLFHRFNEFEGDEDVNCLYCRVDSKRCQIETIGKKFRLPKSKFIFLEVYDGVIFGLSPNSIARFDLQTWQMQATIEINGLPSLLFDGSPTNVVAGDGHFLYAATTTGKKDADLKTNFYVVNLETGNIQTLPHKINGCIKEMSVGADQRLYMCVNNSRTLWTMVNFLEHEEHPDDYFQTWFCRVSLKQPETLLSLAAVALPRPIPWPAYELIRRLNDFPTQLNKPSCVE